MIPSGYVKITIEHGTLMNTHFSDGGSFQFANDVNVYQAG